METRFFPSEDILNSPSLNVDVVDVSGREAVLLDSWLMNGEDVEDEDGEDSELLDVNGKEGEGQVMEVDEKGKDVKQVQMECS